MNPDIIHFQCSACQNTLTVPVHLAGISGPCPTCGQTITSPAAMPSDSRQGLGAAPSYGTIPQPQEKPPAYAMPIQPMAASMQPQTQAGVSTGRSGGLSFPSIPLKAQAATSWPAPELTQTIKSESLPLQSGLPGSAFVQPSISGSLLSQSVASPTAWGSGLHQATLATEIPAVLPSLPQRQAANASLIPGALAPALGSLADRSESNSLLSRTLPAAPMTSSHSQSLQDSPIPPSFQPPFPSSIPSGSFKKPKRGANVAMMGLAFVLVGAAVAAAGWFVREPILQLAERFMPKSAPTHPAVHPESQTPSAPLIDIASSDPKMATSAVVAPTQSLDAREAVPTPFKATPSTTEETVKAAIPTSEKSGPEMTKASAQPVATQGNALMEAPASPTGSPVKQATLDTSSMTTSDRGETILDVPAEAKPAAEALQKFLAASSLEERLKYTLAVDSMKPLMEEYYSKEPSRPIPVDAIGLVRLDPKPQLGGGAHAVFGVESKSWKFAIPVMLEERDGSFKVDWLSFVEFKDRRLENYLTNFQEGQALFHVSMTRTHYFEENVPNSSHKEAFRINPAPPNPFSATVFVDKDSALSRDLRDKIPWGAQVFAIVGLEWMKLGDRAWVQMSSAPQLNWYSVPSASKTVKASSSILQKDSTEMPTETQKAVPIGR